MGETIAERVKQAVVDALGVDEEEVTPDARIVDDLGADSLDVVQLALQLEDEFDLEIPDADAHGMATVQAVIDYVTRRCEARP